MKPMKISGKVLSRMAEYFGQGYYIQINNLERLDKPEHHCVKLAQSTDLQGKCRRTIWATRKREVRQCIPDPLS